MYSRLRAGLAPAVIFPWTELTGVQRERLRRGQEAEPWIPDGLLPYVHEQGCDPETSFGLRLDDDVAGWMLTHRISPLVVRYTCCYARPKVQQHGGSLVLVRAAIEAHVRRTPEALRPVGYGTWTVSLRQQDFATFVRRRMAPYLLSLTEIRESHKALAD
jgi:hypothetical protein